jgi:hypothetical protein
MKKVLLLVAVVAAFSFVSCKKDRVCTCTTSSTEVGSSSSTFIVTYTKSMKHDARGNCMGYTQLDGGVTVTRTCTLK